jgi:hypothetical protein
MGKTDTGFPTGSTMVEWSHGYGFGTEIPHTISIYSNGGCLLFSRKQHRLFLPPGFKNFTRYILEVGSDVRFRRSGRMEKNPQHSSSQPPYLHGLGLTLVTHEAAFFHQRALLPPFGGHMSFKKNLG